MPCVKAPAPILTLWAYQFAQVLTPVYRVLHSVYRSLIIFDTFDKYY